jgi:hypothetical protein
VVYDEKIIGLKEIKARELKKPMNMVESLR